MESSVGALVAQTGRCIVAVVRLIRRSRSFVRSLVRDFVAAIAIVVAVVIKKVENVEKVEKVEKEEDSV